MDTEKLVEELHLGSDTCLEENALPLPNHTHDFDALESSVSSLQRLEPEHRTNSTFDGAVIRFELAVEVFDLPVGRPRPRAFVTSSVCELHRRTTGSDPC